MSASCLSPFENTIAVPSYPKAFYVFVIDPSRVNVYTDGLFGALTPFIDYWDIDGKNPGRSASFCPSHRVKARAVRMKRKFITATMTNRTHMVLHSRMELSNKRYSLVSLRWVSDLFLLWPLTLIILFHNLERNS